MADWSPTDYRLRYIEQELRKNGFRTDSSQLLRRAATEVAYSIFAPAHEQARATYGAFLTDHWQSFVQHIPPFVLWDSIKGRGCDRSLADGVRSFLIRGKRAKSIWLPRSPLTSEAALVSLRDEILFKQPEVSPHAKPAGIDLVIVQRLANGSVTVLHWDGVTTLRDGFWSFRAYQYKYRVEEQLANRIQGLTEPTMQTIRHLFRLCLHALSPRGCGATIVVSLAADKQLKDRINNRNAIQVPPNLSIKNRPHHPVVAHLLAQNDGAMLVDENGDVRMVQAWLKPKCASNDPSRGGTRQLSAEATSKEILSPIFTVSADGPVRVFHRGCVIADSSQ